MEAGVKGGGFRVERRGEYSRDTAAQRRLRRGMKQEIKRKRKVMSQMVSCGHAFKLSDVN